VIASRGSRWKKKGVLCMRRYNGSTGKRIRVVTILLAVGLCIALLSVGRDAFAGLNAYNKVAVHVSSTISKCNAVAFSSCFDIHTTHIACDTIYVIPVHYDLVGVTVVEGALQWPAEWGTLYKLQQCFGSLAIDNFSASGYAEYSYASTSCVTTWAAVPCIAQFYYGVPSPGRIYPLANVKTGFIGVVDCTEDPEPQADSASGLFCAGVCGAQGDDPCGGRDGDSGEGKGTSGGIRGYYKP
jgi:hypothetical protein